ncbi:MAG: hypothetical protein A3I61_03100 [Acidobacteria bacterium RIFCSPLOWO2_02_FULL_68_18]|nr:MAG: hypothetical protein A3I61_03100 [Acidobacteria bacterium RIFCSPLOWO2_02_FULL_68_18]OFW48470.1 MAG: hypothetical protein A3G77_13375 [Acidobacteria bacterium RIFCSPLOWO2_12_FULL_68_19]
MRRTVLLGVIVVALPVIGSTAAQAPQPDLPGVYRCDGKNPDGSVYQGVVEISKVRDTFRVRWTMDDGAIMGVGIYSGGVFAVSYFGGAPAVVVYKVDGNKLVGEWTMGGAEGAVYVETLTKTPGAQVPNRPDRGPDRRPAPRRPAPERDNERGIQL